MTFSRAETLWARNATKSSRRLDPRPGCGVLRRIPDTHGTFIVKGIPEAAFYLQNLNFRAKTRGKACRLCRMEGFAVRRENH